LHGDLAFSGIATVVAQVMQDLKPASVRSIEEIVAADQLARSLADRVADEFVESTHRVAGGLAL
jgi:tRNA A37 threonylcarbamoyltransferase TsaD